MKKTIYVTTYADPTKERIITRIDFDENDNIVDVASYKDKELDPDINTPTTYVVRYSYAEKTETDFYQKLLIEE